MSSSMFNRKEGTKSTRKVILIVCEGKCTEPNYFKSFRLPARVVDVKGAGSNTLSVVQEAVKHSQDYKYDEVWCVFDRDSFPAQRVNSAFSLMRQHNFKHAFSNESFELWYLLHFCYIDSQITRKQYNTKLTGFLKFDYAKNDLKMYEHLLPLQATAIKNAKKLDAAKPLVVGSEANSKPSCTVYKLVERLNKLVARNERRI